MNLAGKSVSLLALAVLGAAAEPAQSEYCRAYADPFDPPADRWLRPVAREAYRLGHAVFNTQWVPVGTPGAGRRAGLGPYYNAAACDACHNEGARGAAPAGDGVLPPALVVRLERSVPGSTLRQPDPVYGAILNTRAVADLPAEGRASVHYRFRSGLYPDGERWTLREPDYRLDRLRYGPLAADTIIEPRLAPALFGVGLLAAVPDAAIAAGSEERSVSRQDAGSTARPGSTGRFGWQAESASLEAQTARAFAEEMGLTSALRPHDDCTPAQTACREAQSSTPEVASGLLSALLVFERHLAVPCAPAPAVAGAALFQRLGCAGCHRPSLSAWVDGHALEVAAFTDLRRHDLGAPLSDRDASGRVVSSRWRTAPLWGLGYAFDHSREVGLLHDGRARSVEEAVLWHEGEAAGARAAFMALPASERAALVAFVRKL